MSIASGYLHVAVEHDAATGMRFTMLLFRGIKFARTFRISNRNGEAEMKCCMSSCLVSIAGFVSLVAVNPARGETFIFDFADSFDSWQQKWDIESPTGTPGLISHSTARGYLDNASLLFDLGDGLGDDGTLWIDKQFLVAAGAPSRVAVSFQLFNTAQSDFNQFQVQAAILSHEPLQQADFTNIGRTETTEGWTTFSYAQDITPPSGNIWVGVGIRVAWETHREYWIDRVVVTTSPVPEPSATTQMFATLVSFAGVMWLIRRKTAPDVEHLVKAEA